MPLRKLPALLLAVMTARASFVSAATLKVGDPAPAITPGKWVKGEPVKEFEKGKIYVMEFWATWCGPCIATMPHLSEVQGKHKDVTFIAQSVWEQDDAKVAPFVESMGEKMAFRVAADDKSTDERGKMAKTWMEAAGRNGIPSTFIVNKEGQIAWIGHPTQLEPVLEKVIAGQFDLAAAKAMAEADAKKQAEMEVIGQAFQAKVGPLLESNDFAGAGKAVDELITTYPNAKADLTRVKFRIFLQGKQYDQAYVAADQLAELDKADGIALNDLAWLIATGPGIEKRDLDRALKYATRAVEVTQEKNAGVIDTLARIYADKGDTAKAIEWETKAVALETNATQKAVFEKTLAEYRAKATK